MDAMQHAWLARRLVKACGGLTLSAHACRIERSHLSRCQDHQNGCFLPADVIADLEGYCGEPIYSRELVAARLAAPPANTLGDLVAEACETAEFATSLQKLIRHALADGVLTPAERRSIADGLGELEQHMRRLRDVATETRS